MIFDLTETCVCAGRILFLTDSQKNSKNKDICFFLSQAKVIREEKIEGQAVRATIGNNGQQRATFQISVKWYSI